MRRRQSRAKSPAQRRPRTAVASTTQGRDMLIKKSPMLGLLRRLEGGTAGLLPPSPNPQATTVEQPAPSTEDQLNAEVGCKTSEVALALLAQIVSLENPPAAASQERVDTLIANAMAMLAELQPTNATEALLAAQMVGTQRMAMKFLATVDGQTLAGANLRVVWATRLMHLFNEQVETMAKLKGKAGQQRVVVEHVTVAAGGQAVVGQVMPGGKGAGVGADQR